jgi:hypothetical protein
MTDIEFQGFPKMARLTRDCLITEKIDGTNAQVCIGEDGEFRVGSRTRWITPDNDNFGFARWAYEHKDELLKLGPGRHFGEWWGAGIQRKYGQKEGKFFSLFNVLKWADVNVRPACCLCVPVLYRGLFDTVEINGVLEHLKTTGSWVVPGFMNPEGIIVHHLAAGVSFKKTLQDDSGKGER